MLVRCMGSLGEVWSAWERFGALGRDLERLGEFYSAWKSFGALGRVLECSQTLGYVRDTFDTVGTLMIP